MKGVSGGSQDHVRHVKHACAVTNPFCSASKGAKFPDGSNGSSIGYQIRGHLAMGGNAVVSGGSGGAGVIGAPATGNIVVLTPSGSYGFVNPATFAAGTWTMAAVQTLYPNAVFFTNNAVAYRIVSFGVVLRCISSVTNSQGYVILGTGSGTGVIGSNITSGSSNYMEQEEVPLTAGMEHCWMSRPTGVSARTFTVPNTIAAVNPNWSCLTVELVGTAGSTTIVDIEYFMNVEIQLSPGNTNAELVPKDPPANTIATQASRAIVDKTTSFVKGGIASVETQVYNAASSFVSSAFRGGLALLTDGIL